MPVCVVETDHCTAVLLAQVLRGLPVFFFFWFIMEIWKAMN